MAGTAFRAAIGHDMTGDLPGCTRAIVTRTTNCRRCGTNVGIPVGTRQNKIETANIRVVRAVTGFAGQGTGWLVSGRLEHGGYTQECLTIVAICTAARNPSMAHIPHSKGSRAAMTIFTGLVGRHGRQMPHRLALSF